MSAVRPEFPGVRFVGVVSVRKGESAKDLARRHRWSFPVAVDRRLDVFNLFRAADCPTTVFAFAGGKVKESRLGKLGVGELRAAARRLAAGPADGARPRAGP